MISRGIEIAAKGMMSLIDFQDSIANNIANVNTAGYKREGLSFRNVYNALVEEPVERNNPKNQDGRLVGEISMGSVTNKLVHEFSQGVLSRTENPLDLGIEGDGFFKLRTPDGSYTYTRNGAFCINSQNLLTDMQGNLVMDDQNQPIRLNLTELNVNSPKDIVVNEDGSFVAMRDENATALQRIGIFDFANKDEMMAVGTSMYVPKDITTNPELRSQKFTVQQGAIELSNASIINEMINSINVSRMQLKEIFWLMLYPFCLSWQKIKILINNLTMRSIIDSNYEEENINSATINAIVNNGKKDFVCKLDLVSEDGMRKVVFREGNRFITTDSYLRMYDALEDMTYKLKSKGMTLKTCQNCQHFTICPDGTLDCLNGKCQISQNEILIWNGCQYFYLHPNKKDN